MKFRLFAAALLLAAAASPAQAKELDPEVTAQRYCMLRDAGVNHNRAWQRATEYGTSKVYRGGDKVISVRSGSAGREDVWLTHHRIKQLCGDQANQGQTTPRHASTLLLNGLFPCGLCPQNSSSKPSAWL